MTFPVLHLVTGADDVRRSGSLDTVRAVCAECGPSLAIHLRIRDSGAAELLELAVAVREIVQGFGSWLVVNRRVDVALCAWPNAVQLGKAALPVQVARALLPPSVRIGASVHDPATAELRVREGCDYLVLGTIYPTSTHPDGPVGGLPLLRQCAETVTGVPIVAIGGIDAKRVAEVMAAGARGIAVNRAVWGHTDPAHETRKLLREAKE